MANNQVPVVGELNLDHVAHFVPHIDAASGALEQLGFTLTPFSLQSHRPEPGGPLTPAGAGNRCVMLQRGYLEFLTPTGDTPVSNQLRTAIKRYVGAHLIAFGTSAPEADLARLAKGGYSPLDPVALQREIDSEEGRETARFTGLLAQVSGSAWRVATGRGYLLFLDAATLERRLDVTPPSLPWIAGSILESASIASTGDYLHANGNSMHVLGSRRLLVRLPPALGGLVIFEPKHSGALEFD